MIELTTTLATYAELGKVLGGLIAFAAVIAWAILGPDKD